MEWRGGDVSGALPYSRVRTAPGNVVAEEPTELVLIETAHLPDMARECHQLTAALVHVMLDRARVFTSSELLDEKMLSLGRLAAGLAHELNNPASAVVRSAKMLVDHLAALEATAVALGALSLSAEARAALARFQKALNEPRSWSPIEIADREDLIGTWLARHHADDVDALPLAASAVTPADLDALAASMDAVALGVSLAHAQADSALRQLASEIETAASRIHTLVAAVKGFTYMDRAQVATPIDLAQGLADTLTVLRPKARSRSIDLRLDLPPNLPAAHGFGGELNQVWANLIDNAIDASPKGGRVTVSASTNQPHVIVRVVDEGPGIPEGIRDRIFDPFFTTKQVGEGSGLGLDLARRIVQRHNGRIDMTTGPGGTEFRVTLPVPGATPAVSADSPQ
jgi:signal transduction histidine kinase